MAVDPKSLQLGQIIYSDDCLDYPWMGDEWDALSHVVIQLEPSGEMACVRLLQHGSGTEITIRAELIGDGSCWFATRRDYLDFQLQREVDLHKEQADFIVSLRRELDSCKNEGEHSGESSNARPRAE